MSFFVTEDPAKRVQRGSGATKPRSLELKPRTDFAAAPKNFEHKFATAPTWASTGRRQNDTWGLAGRQPGEPARPGKTARY
jgi:hypothetical protein